MVIYALNSPANVSPLYVLLGTLNFKVLVKSPSASYLNEMPVGAAGALSAV